MDGVSVIVVVLFVATIFSSLGGDKGHRPKETASEPVAFTQEVISNLPEPDYYAETGEAPYTSILNFVSQYRQEDEAKVITSSIVKYAKDYDVNPKLVTALMARESRFNPSAVSSSGAVGLGQLLPSTCTTVGIADPYDIDQNAKGTARYMKYLLDRFEKYNQRMQFALAGYLEGPNAVERQLGYKSHTSSYIRDIINIYHKI
ncbi:hypothetical protein A3H38_04400 [candidate division WOR-1 bacterium RIFCSPLOWO2_02_FULL_46_20]|uniref:Transglycosylase SLT domain-containing protein n=2 Tax=Saganbacteria TaxID=1703751 RepID=A0A1F4R432_UNCSA|nr:MAG: hypothetical protein A3J44_02755 [candidate division WOR-1 bacterium RIFCSPHIGHO2_02_FULL_45_12]OGC02866.1 MAG: hypothetical protein A3H38_04400 [candidate division WOR-1 bacterium RIFCSPLOWO2_02_FULL_46_20]OGC09720.1 MAG: hypothetical protein A3F86_00845 [candidate division WOR-1 bacterium RIFCSPLOWO2_12_FULL_45_9]